MPRSPKLRNGAEIRKEMGRKGAAIVRRSVAIVKRIRLLPTILSPADVLTLGNGFCGLLAIVVLTGLMPVLQAPFFRFWPRLQDSPFLFAVLLITLGLVCDALDGIVARKFGGSRLGGDLDTLSDTITFVVVPSIMVMKCYGTAAPFPAFLTGSLVFIMGVLRLARFNTNPTETETLTFEGLPTPWCAITISLTILGGVSPRSGLPFITLLAFLMMSSFSYPKSRERIRYLPYLMIVSAIGVILLIWHFPAEQSRIVRTTLVLVALTVALFPFLFARRDRKQKREAARMARLEERNGQGE